MGREKAKELTVPSVLKKKRSKKKMGEQKTAKLGVRMKPGNRNIQCRKVSDQKKRAAAAAL